MSLLVPYNFYLNRPFFFFKSIHTSRAGLICHAFIRASPRICGLGRLVLLTISQPSKVSPGDILSLLGFPINARKPFLSLLYHLVYVHTSVEPGNRDTVSRRKRRQREGAYIRKIERVLADTDSRFKSKLSEGNVSKMELSIVL